MVEGISLYFHLPFCNKKCDYCHFYVLPDKEEHKKKLLSALRLEWELKKPLFSDKKIESIYFGGGTPALFGPERICEILSWADLTENPEITLEINPENANQELLENYKYAGINRISMGAQSFDDSLLKAIGRTHDASQTIKALEILQKAQISNISLDLMYDLPEQTEASWQQTVDIASNLPIQHLSLYNLTIEPHTVFFKKRRWVEKQMPKEEASLQMLQYAVTSFEKNGFHRYEISAFCKEGKESHHNLGYWSNRPFLGFGPSAFSYFNKARFRNIAHLHRYSKLLQAGDTPIDFSETLAEVEREQELLAIGLRLKKGVLMKKWPARVQVAIESLIDKQLIEDKNRCLTLTEKGKLFHDTVAEIIFSF